VDLSALETLERDVAFNVFGAPATYTARGGSPIETRVKIERDVDPYMSDGRVLSVERRTVARVRTDEVPSSGRDDTIVIGDDEYRVDEISADDGQVRSLIVRGPLPGS
jgi:hypothetical protein